MVTGRFGARVHINMKMLGLWQWHVDCNWMFKIPGFLSWSSIVMEIYIQRFRCPRCFFFWGGRRCCRAQQKKKKEHRAHVFQVVNQPTKSYISQTESFKHHLGILQEKLGIQKKKVNPFFGRCLCVSRFCAWNPRRQNAMPSENITIRRVTVRQTRRQRCVGENDMRFLVAMKGHTVDGRNPAPPGMYKTLQIVG